MDTVYLCSKSIEKKTWWKFLCVVKWPSDQMIKAGGYYTTQESSVSLILYNTVSGCIYNLSTAHYNTRFSNPPLKIKINEPFCLQYASNLSFYDNFNKTILLIFLLKLSCENSYVKFDAFSKGSGFFILSLRWYLKS